MAYALRTLIHERSRYLPGVLAVAFSAVLMALQVGLMLGLFEISSIPVDRATANTPEYIWAGSNGIQSVDLGRPIPVSFMARLTQRPGVEMPELFIATFANFEKNDGSTELCFLLGAALTAESGGANMALTPDLRAKLSEPRTIVMDETDLKRMKLAGVGDRAKINGKEVTLVGLSQTAAKLDSGAAGIAGDFRGRLDDGFNLTEQSIRIAQCCARLCFIVKDKPTLVHRGHESRWHPGPGERTS